MNCVFCKIIAGESPAEFRADGISSVAIAPLKPVAPGHLLVIPRRHVANAYEDPRITATAMHDAASWAQLFSYRDPRYESVNLITSVGEAATQTVNHLHIHIVPRHKDDGLHLPWTGQH